MRRELKSILFSPFVFGVLFVLFVLGAVHFDSAFKSLNLWPPARDGNSVERTSIQGTRRGVDECQRRQTQLHEDFHLSREAETENDHLLWENAEMVHRALQTLSLEHREVVTLHFLEDMRLEEIAEALRCPLGTVKSRLYYAKQALRQALEKRLYD